VQLSRGARLVLAEMPSRKMDTVRGKEANANKNQAIMRMYVDRQSDVLFESLFSSTVSFDPSFGAFPQTTDCLDAVLHGASGVYSAEECPFLQADFIKSDCCSDTIPEGIECPVCRPGQELINP
jgi:hypothetical protein